MNNCISSSDYNSYIYTYILNNKKDLKQEKLLLKIIRRDKNTQDPKKFGRELRAEQLKLRTWYIKQLLSTQQPFREKMVLFWHNHFVSSLQKVRHAKIMQVQNNLFRKYALGNFKEFVHQIIRDPAMIIYLDNRANKKSHPNENFARELLELFTIGEGNYTEKDIKELAKGLTGYTIDKKPKFKFRKNIHDSSKKTFMGKTGNFTADDMIDILFTKKEVSVFITTKLYKEFISYDVDEKEVDNLAKIFRDSNYEISTLLNAVFLSTKFQEKSSFNTMIKSPLELTIGTLRSFEYKSFNKRVVLRHLKKMEQPLFVPPNVKGFKGEYTWVNANTSIARKEFLAKISREESIYKTQLNKSEIEENLGLVQTLSNKKMNKKQFIRKILFNTIYQLK